MEEDNGVVVTSTEYSDIDGGDDSLDIPTISVPDYQDHMGLAVGVLVTVIVILIVAIIGILYKNYQYARQKHWLDTSQPQTTNHTQEGGLIYSQTSEEVYPLYPSYHDSTIYSNTVSTSHYATADIRYLYDERQHFGV